MSKSMENNHLLAYAAQKLFMARRFAWNCYQQVESSVTRALFTGAAILQHFVLWLLIRFTYKGYQNTSDKPEKMDYDKLLMFMHSVAESARRSQGFVSRRGEYGYHILFDESEMSQYFDMIRNDLAKGKAGACLRKALLSGAIRPDSSNKHIWNSLIQSLKFSGMDFEHRYNILPTQGGDMRQPSGIWDYSFAESIVLGHTLLVVPVMQHYGPLMPKLDLKGPIDEFEHPQPLLAVGMVGDCVKGSFFDEIKRKAEEGDEEAQWQKDVLLNPERLQQKMRALTRSLLCARLECGISGLLLDATLVGSGAFGGSTKLLAQPFADSLNGDDMPFNNAWDEVNFYIFPPPKPEEFTLEHAKYKGSLNNKKGLGGAAEAGDDRVRVIVAGFDPISLAPHGVMNRAFSAEAQLCHTTDFLYRITNVMGRFMRVEVQKGRAWESAVAFFSKPQEPKLKDDEAYKTVRFVPQPVLKALGVEEGQEVDVELKAVERVPPRVWNGDAFEGWTLSLGGVPGQLWQEVLHSK
mmetsp:Transcript_88353/g.156419  ORF Transcript_88353/g.156419 Transcript_88353/m.156419 type:complete len:521 (-) Transcript_88353:52-1614(-)